MIYKKIIGFLLFIFSLPSFACLSIEPQEKEYAALDVAIVSGNHELRDFLIHKFCFNHVYFYKKMELEHKDYQGILKARDIEDLKAVFKDDKSISIFNNGNFNRDLLSFYLLPYHMPHIDKFNKTNAESYLNKKLIFNFVAPNDKTHDEILNYIISRYKKESYIFSDNNLKFNNFHFAIIGNNPAVFQELFSFNNLKDFIYQKNSYGFMPIHYLFSKSLDYNKKLQNDNQIKMNEIIVSKLTQNDIMLNSYNGYNFIYYVEIMKEKNLNLYQLLQKKFPFTLEIKNRLQLQKEISNNLNHSLIPIINSYKN